EKTQVQALDRTQPSLPMKKGRGGTLTHDYKRNGTTDLFAAMNIATGEDLHVEKDLEIHVVLDNLSAHKAPPVVDWLAHPKRKRWHLHFTPTSSSWCNRERLTETAAVMRGSESGPPWADVTPQSLGRTTGSTSPTPTGMGG